MEQLRIRADRFRKQGRLCDEDIDEIINEMKANGGTIDDDTDIEVANASNDKNRRVRQDYYRHTASHQTLSNKEYSKSWGRIATDLTTGSEGTIN
jgi:hypothetical protein